MGNDIDKVEHRLAALAQHGQTKCEQDSEKQNLQNFAFGEGSDYRVRYDVHKKFGGALLARFGRVDLNRLGIDGLGIDAHADARLHDVDDHEPDDEGECRRHLEID